MASPALAMSTARPTAYSTSALMLAHMAQLIRLVCMQVALECTTGAGDRRQLEGTQRELRRPAVQNCPRSAGTWKGMMLRAVSILRLLGV